MVTMYDTHEMEERVVLIEVAKHIVESGDIVCNNIAI